MNEEISKDQILKDLFFEFKDMIADGDIKISPKHIELLPEDLCGEPEDEDTVVEVPPIEEDNE